MKKTLTDREKLAQEIGVRIRRQRMKLRVTQDQLALAIGLADGSSIYHYEMGDVEVSGTMLVMIAAALKVSVTSLLPDPPGAQYGTLEGRLNVAWKGIGDENSARILTELAERLAQPKEPTHQKGRADAACNPLSEKHRDQPSLLALMGDA